MAIYLPGTGDESAMTLEELTPREIVAALDKYVVGQAAAKRAVAVALRNRTRRQKLAPELADEISPKNILMIGSTGVGKTEIARRLAKLSGAPFLKVEASKFTEVGYVGRDVESMIRDLVETSIDMVREEKLEEIEDRAEMAAEERLLDLLMARASKAEAVVREEETRAGTSDERVSQGSGEEGNRASDEGVTQSSGEEKPSTSSAERERLRQQLREGKLDDETVEVETRDRNPPQVEIVSNAPDEVEGSGLRDLITSMVQGRSRKRPMKVADAFDYLTDEAESNLLDMEGVTRAAIERVEDAGIVFLDEIDKIAGREGGHGPDISREGVQRDILPIVEGTTVNTKYGNVSTDHILFIAAGAFHVSKPSDLIPELQGRFPIRVELQALTVEDFLRILTEPRASLVKQATSLLETEGLTLEFEPDALRAMAELAFQVNETTENIGARRLHTVLERVLDEVSFHAPEMVEAAEKSEPMPEGESAKLPALTTRERGEGQPAQRVVTVTAEYVRGQLENIVKQQDLAKYIL